MSDSEYEKIQAVPEQARGREIWKRMEALRRDISAQNRDLTEAQREPLADEISRAPSLA
jgi:hypothetical protein